MVENLARFGLCVVRTPDQALNRLRQQVEENPTFLERYTHVGVTNLGEAFVAACSAPAGARTGAQASDPA